ncbi:MAG: hypothetical protein ACTSSJ_04610 [Candidatus Odinarchaeia archaeon]
MGIRVFRVVEGKLEAVEPGKFATGDAYIIDAGDEIYTWIGKKSSIDEKFISAYLSTLIDKARKGKTKIVHIEEGAETPGFLKLFKGEIVVTKEDAPGLLKPVVIERPKEIKMYKVSGLSYDEVKFSQVPLKRENLDSSDVFIIDAFDKIYVWIGRHSSGMERFRGRMLAERFDAERAETAEVISINEGEETEDFWKIFKK